MKRRRLATTKILNQIVTTRMKIKQRRILKDYARMMFEREDWHAARDAIVDLEKIDTEITAMRPR